MIRETEVDGVPTLIAPTSGPMAVGLLFRVGRVDETLPTAGITHMVEHLALHRHGIANYHYNGTTCTYYTSFHMRGSESAVVDYLSGVCDSLADMPMHRLETEKSILRTEAAGRGRSANEQLPLWRYGARGHGIVSYPEWGVSRLQPTDIEHWVQTWFTRGNAVLWIAGDDVPPGLKLNLRDGVRQPLPAATSALPVQPAYFSDDDGKVVLDAVVRHRVAVQVYSGVLERELYRSLRQDGGYSYTAATAYEARGDGFGTLTAVADALPEMQDAVVGGFIDVLAKLRVGRIDEADVEAVRGQALEGFGHPEVHAARLAGQAVNVLIGQPVSTLDQVREEITSAGVAEVHEVATEVARTALLQVPQGHDALWAGFAKAPITSSNRLNGPVLQGLEHDGVQLVLGPDGVTQVYPSGFCTVLFTETEICLSWPDGARRLVGSDGLTIHFEPTLYANGGQAVAAIDAGVPQQKVVQLEARDPEEIPQPAPKELNAEQKVRRRGWTELAITAAVTVAVAYLAVSLANAWTPQDGEWAEKATLGLLGAAGAGFVRVVFLLGRRHRRGHW